MFSLIRTILMPITRVFNIADIYTGIGEKIAIMHDKLADIDITLQLEERKADLETRLAAFRSKQDKKPASIAAKAA